jgi:hypothetical protein
MLHTAWRLIDNLKHFAQWLGVIYILVCLGMTSEPKQKDRHK